MVFILFLVGFLFMILKKWRYESELKELVLELGMKRWGCFFYGVVLGDGRSGYVEGLFFRVVKDYVYSNKIYL